MKRLLPLIIIVAVLVIVCKIFFNRTLENTYPFSDADKVELFFYEGEAIDSDLKYFNKIPIKKKIELSKDEIQNIFEILYKENCFVQTTAACYNPRHAFVFKKQNKTIGIIEICVECSRIEVSEGLLPPTLCDNEMIKIERFLQARE
ncbi:hypothetical protein CHRY9390_00097 [Chryseobacterium aquaeductus]|uniref:Uncharacterized protein n=1 Tax=Chryseobacterium aquaeductus TaxID=2675056 RepID=A0A9N8MDJ3_9FLAO|nr:hypothetical protein [Chryseobacterium aquaeductus]CAA7329460.1 hypothetical protein CHRY9390_00097 [Chryseobacterium potabilaquae]CAD7797021.1 hypothetical protein CHRY9390_00097 [Chryseobacterium aquaeductus]